ncbi:xylose operon transcription regulator XylR [Luteolibacter luteus]|uniref:Substrate-binding domain-containing protein n=1 Tax=Luteolibacter luteus TaxID=2728835 RepID=A0A858RI05_9BACT|nr:DNA-binding transcriptional regulator [Luteolibacter luteus]QJE96138.1 substrate-binding domain-containing protein [Luteolibacter luteus]
MNHGPTFRRTWRVGIRMVDWAQGFGNRIYGGILDFLREGHSFELEFVQPSGSDLPAVTIDENWQGDGLLVFRYTPAEARAWRKSGIKVVNLSSEQPPRGVLFPRVTLENQAAGRLAAEHLLGLGLRSFAFLHDPGRTYSRERLEGYRARLHEDGHTCRILPIPSSSFSPKIRARQIEQMAWRIMASLEAPCGLFAKDDISGVTAIRALKQVGMRVPEDVPVVGVSDDIVFCHATTPALSSVRFPGKQIGRAAAELLFRMMSGETMPPETRILAPSPGITVRESTGRVELPDPVVTRAMNFIRSRPLNLPIDTELLCREAGASREQLRQRFHATLGRTPKQEVDRIRSARVSDLLKRTDWTLERLAEHCGFSGGDELCRFMKRVTGSTPGEIRRGL